MLFGEYNLMKDIIIEIEDMKNLCYFKKFNLPEFKKMNSTIVPVYSMIIAFLLISVTGISQNAALNDSANVKLLNAAREIMVNTGTCALITLDNEGRPRARTMDPFLPEDNFTVWFGTNSKSRKVDQIKNDPRVTLYYFDSESSGYVMIHGIAQLIDDSKKKEKYWKKEWEAYYPNKSESYMLIKVSPIWMEVLSPAHGVNNDPITWQPPIFQFNTSQ